MAEEEASSCNTHTGLYLGLGIGLLGNHGQEQNRRSKKACPSSSSLVSLGLSFTPPPYDEDMQVMNGVDQQHHKSDDPHDYENDENGNNNNNAIRNGKKKLRLTKDQSSLLEETFKLHPTLTPAQKQSLAEQLNLKPRQVEVWFQNRRARSKLKQTEIDCEFLKKCCENLSNENRRLKMEIEELRTLSQTKTTTEVSLCPSCEKNYYG